MDTVATRPLLLLVDDDPIIVDSLGLVLEDNFTLYTAGRIAQHRDPTWGKIHAAKVGQRELEAELELAVEPGASAIAKDVAAEQALTGGGFRLDESLADWERQYISAAIRLSAGE